MIVRPHEGLDLFCRYVRCLNLPGNAPPQLLAIASGPGVLLAHSWETLAIHAYTINGRHLATAEGTERLNAFAVSEDGRFLLTGGAKGVITLRWIHSLQVRPSGSYKNGLYSVADASCNMSHAIG